MRVRGDSTGKPLITDPLTSVCGLSWSSDMAPRFSSSTLPHGCPAMVFLAELIRRPAFV